MHKLQVFPLELKEILDKNVSEFNHLDFIANDPIQIPHRFTKKEDIEISGFLTACIAWGNRVSILKSADKMMQIMNHKPFEFVKNYKSPKKLIPFVHRTFQADDFDFFLRSLGFIYENGGLEQSFKNDENISGVKGRIIQFRKLFLKTDHLQRSEKHLSNPLSGSACKRINMFLRWMVRKDDCGVDFGIWQSIFMSELYVPLDLHTGNTARALGLLKRNKNDWTALEELQTILLLMDPQDPVKYDFALFGLGINKKI